MLVVLVIAGLAVIACVVMVSLGHGGEMAEFPSDAPPLGLPAAGQLTPTDLMTLRLPISLVGYGTHAVDETLNRVSVAIAERDTRIAVLEQRVSELAYGQPRTREAADETADQKADERADAATGDRPEVPVAAVRESAVRETAVRETAVGESRDGDRSDAEETW
ncbi:hypothetical protein OG320_08115 [Microbispora sp. NBC_01189]|uniref:hypothetical protein n=1 Tax=Microbispora sp. NBC_01189 TaxID=2903583 RepID=UPI002E10F81C|nr:hypothetical protein OG320_08115 [Microbispora sp. NBC_01189]